MKQFIYIAISILGIGAFLSGCAGSGNKSSNSVTVEKNSEFPFVGCWSAADGSMLYIDDEIEEGSNAGVYRGHLYCEYAGKQGYYDECLIFHGDEESWEIVTADEYDYTLDDFEYNGGNEDVIRDGIENTVEDITYHRDPSIADKIGQKIRKTIKQQEKAPKEEKIKIPRKYKWIYGEWSSGKKSFTIKKPNLIYLNDSYGWLEFVIDGDILYVDIAQDWIEFTLKTANKTIVDESENIYVKEGSAPKDKSTPAKSSSTGRKNSRSKNSTDFWTTAFNSRYDRWLIFKTEYVIDKDPLYIVLRPYNDSKDGLRGRALIMTSRDAFQTNSILKMWGHYLITDVSSLRLFEFKRQSLRRDKGGNLMNETGGEAFYTVKHSGNTITLSGGIPFQNEKQGDSKLIDANMDEWLAVNIPRQYNISF